MDNGQRNMEKQNKVQDANLLMNIVLHVRKTEIFENFNKNGEKWTMHGGSNSVYHTTEERFVHCGIKIVH